MGKTRNSLQISADDESFHIPSLDLLVHASLRTRLHLQLQAVDLIRPRCMQSTGPAEGKEGTEETDSWKRTQKGWKWNLWLESSAVPASSEVELACQLFSLPWVLMSDRVVLLRLPQAEARSMSPPCNSQCLPRSLGEVICALQLVKSKWNTRSKTPLGP